MLKVMPIVDIFDIEIAFVVLLLIFQLKHKALIQSILRSTNFPASMIHIEAYSCIKN